MRIQLTFIIVLKLFDLFVENELSRGDNHISLKLIQVFNNVASDTSVDMLK